MITPMHVITASLASSPFDLRPTLSKSSLTVRLPPAEVVLEVLIRGVQRQLAIEGRGILQLLRTEVALPQHREGRGEQADHVRQDFAGAAVWQ